MNEATHSPEDFVDAFESAFARLQVAIEGACVTRAEWPEQIALGIRTALEFAAADPAAARSLTTDAMANGRAGFARYDRMVSHFGERLLMGRDQRPEGRYLPEITERAMISGLAMLIAQRVDLGRHIELPALGSDAIQFVLTPYLGAEEARHVAGAA